MANGLNGNSLVQQQVAPIVLPPFGVTADRVPSLPDTSSFSLAQPNINLLGVNIPAVPLISFRDYFLATMESWVTSLPLRTQYVAFFDTFPAGLNTNFIQTLEPTDASKKNFDINGAKKVLTSYPLQGIVGCIFLQGADIPGENLTGDSARIDNNRGFIQGSILQGREAYASNNLTLQFRETNTSFVDMIMRPWLILASHAGYVARKRTDPLNCKTNITLVQYTRSYQKISQIPRKVWHFYNCVPLNVSTRNLSYDSESMESYNVSFLYDNYGIENNLYLPLPDIITRISKNSIPRISPLQK